MPRAEDWVRVDGTRWWRNEHLRHLPTPQVAIPSGRPLPLQGNALSNIQFDSRHSHLGVVLGGSKMLLEEGETAPGALGLQAATMRNGCAGQSLHWAMVLPTRPPSEALQTQTQVCTETCSASWR